MDPIVTQAWQETEDQVQNNKLPSYVPSVARSFQETFQQPAQAGDVAEGLGHSPPFMASEPMTTFKFELLLPQSEIVIPPCFPARMSRVKSQPPGKLVKRPSGSATESALSTG